MATNGRRFVGYIMSADQSERPQRRSPWKRGPDGAARVDELLMSLSFTKTERNFRSGSSECKQTEELQGEGRKRGREGGRVAFSQTERERHTEGKEYQNKTARCCNSTGL